MNMTRQQAIERETEWAYRMIFCPRESTASQRQTAWRFLKSQRGV